MIPILCLLAFAAGCGGDKKKEASQAPLAGDVAKTVPAKSENLPDENKQAESREPGDSQSQAEAVEPLAVTDKPAPETPDSTTRTEDPVETESVQEEAVETPVEPEKKDPVPAGLVDPDLDGELAEALTEFPDFNDKQTRKKLFAEATDFTDLQTRNKGGKAVLYKDDSPCFGWVKKMRGNGRFAESLGFYFDGLRDGPWISWQGNGTTKREMALFQKGRKNGLYVTWYGSGKKKEAAIYQDDVRHGPCITWYGSGKKKEFATYRKNVRHGPCVLWSGSGKKTGEGAYETGKKHGPWVIFASSGQTRNVTYKNGSLVRE